MSEDVPSREDGLSVIMKSETHRKSIVSRSMFRLPTALYCILSGRTNRYQGSQYSVDKHSTHKNEEAANYLSIPHSNKLQRTSPVPPTGPCYHRNHLRNSPYGKSW